MDALTLEIGALFEQRLVSVDVGTFGFGSNRIEGTRRLSDAIGQLCSQLGWPCYREQALPRIEHQFGRRGVVDFFVEHPSSGVVVEVDSSNKLWSLRKLVYAAELGFCPIWVRWCNPVSGMHIPAPIYVVDISR